MLCSSHPFLNLTVTGSLVAAFTLFTISYASFGSFIRAEPSPAFTTLGAGHPIFISIISNLLSSVNVLAASAIKPGSLPNI